MAFKLRGGSAALIPLALSQTKVHMRSLTCHINQSLDAGCTQGGGNCGMVDASRRENLSNKPQHPLDLVSEAG